MRVHRVLGYRPRAGGLEIVTQGDHTLDSDLPVPRSEVIGKVRGGDCSPAAVDIPIRDRVRALLRFFRLAASRLANRIRARRGA